MNLDFIFQTQIKLDEEILKSVDKDEKDLEYKKIIALLVELGEFANEVKTFKYWKKHRDINYEAMLEEYADGIHFLTSIAYHNDVNSDIKIIVKDNDFNRQLGFAYIAFAKLFKKRNKKNIQNAFGIYLGLGRLVNISYDDILSSYMKKNKKNYLRIKNNY
ncbi:dUTP diphosphatase [Metamycoplasma equirhinis]|uniref:dUTP diphosphatase n=1 Tax=Metamycoplasma equirhinis TaxID=92402 RepID=UPI00359C821B